MPRLGSRLYWPLLPIPSTSSAALAPLSLQPQDQVGLAAQLGQGGAGFDFGQLTDAVHQAAEEPGWPARALQQGTHAGGRRELHLYSWTHLYSGNAGGN